MFQIFFARRGNALLLGSLILLYLLPLVVLPFFPSQDGPSHVENANIILNYTNPAYPAFAKFYTLNFAVPTNWLGHLALAALMSFAPPPIAEKIFLAACIILFPLALRYALRAIQPGADWLALCAFPFVHSFVLFKGFYNLYASLPLYLFLLGYWLRRRESLDLRALGALVLLSLLVYAAHVVSWVMAALGISALACWFALRAARTQPISFRNLLRYHITPLVIIFGLPTILLAFFVLRGSGTPFSIVTVWDTALYNLVRLSTVISLDRREAWFAIAFAAGTGAVSAAQLVRRFVRRQSNVWDGLLLVCLGYVLVYLLAPNAFAGGSFVKQRLMIFPFLVLTLWLGSCAFSKWGRRLCVMALSVWIVGILIIRLGAWNNLTLRLADLYSTAEHIPIGSVMLPLSLTTEVDAENESTYRSNLRVLLHGAGYIAAARQAIDLTNYEALTDYFPLRYRAAYNPRAFARELASGNPSVRLAAYEQTAHMRVDYVLLIAEDKPFGDSFAPPEALLRQLAENYTLVYVSPQRRAQLYRRNP